MDPVLATVYTVHCTVEAVDIHQICTDLENDIFRKSKIDLYIAKSNFVHLKFEYFRNNASIISRDTEV